ncbi:MAG TPA: ATP-binding protein [Candidatus Dormibacteraeota bacterium]|jgi:signal transduction histidine kinase|nr:ATP-binding protein [Candidatus Dormibacteraeota bacterium]
MLIKHRSLIAPPIDDGATVVFGLISCLLLLSVAAVVDLQFSVAIFYALPIALAAWLFGRWIGAGVTAFSIVATTSIALFGHHYLGALPIFVTGLVLVGIVSIVGSQWARRSDELVDELNRGDRRHRQLLDTLTRVGQELVTGKRIEVIAGLVMDSLVGGLELDAAWAYQRAPDGGLKMLACSGVLPAATGEPIHALERAGMASWLELPVRVKGRSWGTVVLATRRQRAWTSEERGIAIALVNQLGLAMENASAYRAAIEAMVRLEEVNQLKSDFMKTASHELRTPMTVLSGYMDMMSDGSLGRVPNGWAKPISQVKLKVIELNRLVQMMLDASRSESADLKLDLEETDIGPVLELAIAAQEADADRAGAYLQFDAPPGPAMARFDRDKILVVLRNLVENAVKYSPAGSTIDIGHQEVDGEVRIWVADRGPGIRAGDKAHVFEQFYRVQHRDQGAIGGTGLGLYIVRQLTEAQGGTISIEDRSGGGSIFTVTLPRANGVKPPVVAARSATG